MKTRFFFAAFLFAVVPFASACGSDPVVDQNTNKVLESIDIVATDGEDTTMKKGTTQKFNAIAKYADNTSKDVSTDPGTVWTSSATDDATVDKTGVVTAVNEGAARITASYSGKNGTEDLIITP